MGRRRQDPRKAAELQQSWDRMLQQHAKPLERGAQAKGVKKAPLAKPDPITIWNGSERRTPHHPSKVTAGQHPTLAPAKKYTGTLIKGIATMHKSNAIPVLNQEDAIAVANMRR